MSETTIEIEEDSLNQVSIRFERIRAIADSIGTVDRAGETDSLRKYTVYSAMETIENLCDEAKKLLDH